MEARTTVSRQRRIVLKARPLRAPVQAWWRGDGVGGGGDARSQTVETAWEGMVELGEGERVLHLLVDCLVADRPRLQPSGSRLPMLPV